MSDNEIEKKIVTLRGLINTGLSNISSWIEIAPDIERTNARLAWIQDSISVSPSAVNNATSEELLDYLDKAEQGLSILNNIPFAYFS